MIARPSAAEGEARRERDAEIRALSIEAALKKLTEDP